MMNVNAPRFGVKLHIKTADDRAQIVATRLSEGLAKEAKLKSGLIYDDTNPSVATVVLDTPPGSHYKWTRIREGLKGFGSNLAGNYLKGLQTNMVQIADTEMTHDITHDVMKDNYTFTFSQTV